MPLRLPRTAALLPLAALALACSDTPTSESPAARFTAGSATSPVNVSHDTTAQNETPLAANPRNTANLITGANDWNYNDGCAVNASFDGGRSWTATLPNGFLPGVTKFTNDPAVAGTGSYDAGGDPAIAFGPDGTAYFVCQAFTFGSPTEIALLLSRSTDGGRTWLDGRTTPLVHVANWQGNGKSKGSNGQFADHESIFVDQRTGFIYVSWVQFNGNSSHSPVLVAVSRDGGHSFAPPVRVTQGPVRNNQDARIVSGPDGTLYLTFDTGVQGGKGTVIYASRSGDGGTSWSTPAQVATFNNPVCAFPPSCFNLSGGPFRAGGSYPVPAFDATRNRLYVTWDDIAADGRAKVYLAYAAAPAAGQPVNLSSWTMLPPLAGTGDRFEGELGISSGGRLDLAFYDRSYSGNTLVDVTLASSSDGGATWQTQRISTAGFDPSLYGVPSGSGIRPFIGDYNGLVSLPDRALMTWTGVGPKTGALETNLEIFFAGATP